MGMNGGSVGRKRETGEEKRETADVLAELRVSAGTMRAHASVRDGGGGGALRGAVRLRPPPCPPVGSSQHIW